MRSRLPSIIAALVALLCAPAARGQVSDAAKPAAAPFPLNAVRLTGGPFLHAQQLNVNYLLSLETDRLLASFRKEAGLAPRGKAYGGWEGDSLAGHSLGHYLSACSMAFASTGDERLKRRVDEVVAELAACQLAHGDGYVAAIPGGKAMFEEVRRGEIRSSGFDLNGQWAPWYNVHKLFAGLLHAHQSCGNAQALDVLVGLADWAHRTTAHLTQDQLDRMLACEHGGMNEALADLYAITGDPRHLDLAVRVFHHHAVLDPLAEGVDCLPGLHANTQIPKVIGLARLSELTSDPQPLATARFFWREVLAHHTYVNGGNSSHEYFGPRDEISTRLGETTEACNTYNMLRLARKLFAREPKAEYFDYYERALWNHILAHQHPTSGMLMYKGFLDPGAKKGFSSPFDSFWCCVGSGMESHAKHNDSIYFHDDDGIWINLFIPSTLDWAERGIMLVQRTTLPEGDAASFELDCQRPVDLELRFRRPVWATDGFQIAVNGEPLAVDAPAGEYVVVARTWRDGDRIDMHMPHALRFERTPDDPRVVAFLDGPILLCADLGDDSKTPLLVCEEDRLLQALRPVPSQPLHYAAEALGRVVEVSPENVADFGAPQAVRLVPHHSLVDRHYSVYLHWLTSDAWEAESPVYRERLAQLALLQARTVDVLRIGEMQPERDHRLQGEKSGVNAFRGKKFRVASDGGWFAFEMKVDGASPMTLMCTYWGDEQGDRTFDVLIDEEKVATQTLHRDKPGEFFDVLYEVPAKLTAGKTSVVVRFQAHPGHMAGGLFDACRMLRPDQPPAENP